MKASAVKRCGVAQDGERNKNSHLRGSPRQQNWSKRQLSRPLHESRTCGVESMEAEAGGAGEGGEAEEAAVGAVEGGMMWCAGMKLDDGMEGRTGDGKGE